MAIYTDKWPTSYALNTVTELELTTSQNISSNYTRVNYVVRVKKINNWNDNWTPASGGSYLTLTIGGTTVRNAYRSNWTTANNAANATVVVDSGHVDVYHNADGTKVIDYRMELNPNVSVIGRMPNRVISGSFTVATIPRTSSFTVSSSLTTGSNYTVNITRASASFTHRIYRKIGSSEVQLTSSAVASSHTINMPHSLFNSYPNHSSISASIIVKTFNGATQIGSSSQNVTINLISTAVPTNSTTAVSNSDSKPFSVSNQLLRGVSRLTLGTGTVGGSYSSTITSYEFSYQQAGRDWSPTVSSNTKTYTYPAFNFPNSGSVVLNVRSRVRDSRGRYSNWATVNGALRVHAYSPPSIGSISVRRAGSGNTTLQVYRSHSVTPLYQQGSTSNQRNTASLRFETRGLGASTVTANTGGRSTSLSTAAAWVNLAGSFDASKSYQVRAVLSDARQTVYGSWVSVGTEFVPLDVGFKGVGVGKVHSDGSADLEVGSGGVNSDGAIKRNGFDISQNRHGNYKDFTVEGNANTYYPVVIRGQAQFGFHRYSITRGYNWDAPNTWNNTTHRGGLTLDIEWSGDNGWGGNDKSVRVIEFNETYSRMVGGIALGRGDGTPLIVWLRGGGALYRLYSEMGSMATVNVHIGNFTDGSGKVFAPRTSPVDSEIYNRYPVRGNGELYSLGHKVLSENDVRTLLAGSPSNFDSNTFIQMVRTGVGHPVINFDANNFLHGIVWCYGSNTGTPPGDGLLFAYRINSNQATQIYFSIDNKLYQRQRDWKTLVWGAWSNGR